MDSTEIRPRSCIDQHTSQSIIPTPPECEEASTTHARILTRRRALCAFLGIGALSAALSGQASWHSLAFAADHSGVDEAQEALDDAQDEYDKVKDQLDQISEDYEALATEQAETLADIEAKESEIDDTQVQIDSTQTDIDKKQGQIEATQADINQTEADIEATQAELDQKKEVLAKRVSSAYKSGGSHFLGVLMSSTSFEDLASNIYYLDKISQADAAMIEDVQVTKAALDDQKALLEDQKATLEDQKATLEDQKATLEDQKATLEDQKNDLEDLNAEQQQQLDEMKAKQDEVQDTLDGLSDEVAKLVEDRDAEIVAYNKAREEEEAQAKAAAAESTSSSGTEEQSATTGSQQKVVNACHSVGSPGLGYCAMWVSLVFQRAGYGYIGGDANDMYAAYCHSSNRSALKVGMIVAVSTHNHTSAGRIYGHVAIYVGNGTLMDNVGYVRTISLNKWISWYSTTVTPRWGWAGNIVLT